MLPESVSLSDDEPLPLLLLPLLPDDDDDEPLLLSLSSLSE
jgi:hypothetical protein